MDVKKVVNGRRSNRSGPLNECGPPLLNPYMTQNELKMISKIRGPDALFWSFDPFLRQKCKTISSQDEIETKTCFIWAFTQNSEK